MTKTQPLTHKNPKLIIFLLLLVLAGPFLFAYFLVQKGNAYQFRLANHGDLISPPISINEISFVDRTNNTPFSSEKFAGKWWLVYKSTNKCQQSCHQVLHDLRQIRTALGKDAARLEHLFLAYQPCEQNECKFLKDNYPNMLEVMLSQSDVDFLFGRINSQTQNTDGEIYIIDPKGNIMMRYDPNTQPKAILSDLKRLLKISKIG